MKQWFWLSGVAGLCAGTAIGATVESADVVFLVDESGSMAGEQAFLEQVIPDLDNALATAGVTTRNFGVVGYAFTSVPRIVRPLGSASAAANNLDADLVTRGSREDGYSAIDIALNNLSLTAAATNFILVTDEDRDNADRSLSFNSILSSLTAAGAVLNAVVNLTVLDTVAGPALGADSDGDSYVADGSGGFAEGTFGGFGSGFGSTEEDYADLAFASGGAVWDLNFLRQGGLLAESFASAFIDIKVQEITGVPIDPPTIPGTPVIPLPAPILMMLTAIGGLLGLRLRAKPA